MLLKSFTVNANDVQHKIHCVVNQTIVLTENATKFLQSPTVINAPNIRVPTTMTHTILLMLSCQNQCDTIIKSPLSKSYCNFYTRLSTKITLVLIVNT